MSRTAAGPRVGCGRRRRHPSTRPSCRARTSSRSRSGRWARRGRRVDRDAGPRRRTVRRRAGLASNVKVTGRRRRPASTSTRRDQVHDLGVVARIRGGHQWLAAAGITTGSRQADGRGVRPVRGGRREARAAFCRAVGSPDYTASRGRVGVDARPTSRSKAIDGWPRRASRAASTWRRAQGADPRNGQERGDGGVPLPLRGGERDDRDVRTCDPETFTTEIVARTSGISTGTDLGAGVGSRPKQAVTARDGRVLHRMAALGERAGHHAHRRSRIAASTVTAEPSGRSAAASVSCVRTQREARVARRRRRPRVSGATVMKVDV